jgi:hypothetical protein
MRRLLLLPVLLVAAGCGGSSTPSAGPPAAQPSPAPVPSPATGPVGASTTDGPLTITVSKVQPVRTIAAQYTDPTKPTSGWFIVATVKLANSQPAQVDAGQFSVRTADGQEWPSTPDPAYRPEVSQHQTVPASGVSSGIIVFDTSSDHGKVSYQSAAGVESFGWTF